MLKKDNVKISIITVCYNSEIYIERTIQSVINQAYNNIEYIIVDGKSSDKTLDIINKYRSRIKLISENDKGIYDAMNKGIDLATGDFIIFMNSGDKFIDDKVLEKFSEQVSDEKYDIYYGNIIETLSNDIIGRIKFDKIKINTFNILKGDSICHQCMFTKSSVLKENKFDLKYSICADKNFIVEVFKKGYCFKYIDLDIAFYDRSGISSVQTKKLKREAKDIMYDKFPIKARIMYFIKAVKNKLEF